MTKTVQYQGQYYDAEIEYRIEGKRRPMTMHSPEEYPEVFWEAMYFTAESGHEICDGALFDELNEELLTLGDQIETEILERESDAKEAAREARDHDDW